MLLCPQIQTEPAIEMKRLSWIFLQLLLLTSMFPSSLSATTRSRGKKKVPKKAREVNICMIETQAPIYCTCNSVAISNATDATCVVLSPFSANDPTWNHFSSQNHLQKLQFVVRTPNGLEYVPVELLRQLKNLQKIGFQYTSINELTEFVFSNLSTITEINLSKNSISILRMHAFENMKNLSVIYLNENRITEINR